MKHLFAVLFALSILILSATTVAAHDITSVKVNCDEQTITITGVNFPATQVQVSGTGANDFSAQFDVQGSWTKVLDGPFINGLYTITWPNAGNHATEFTVECAEATPTPTPEVTPTPRVTPTPTGTEPPAATGTPRARITPPPTSTSDTTQSDSFSPVLVVVVFFILGLAFGMVTTSRARRR